MRNLIDWQTLKRVLHLRLTQMKVTKSQKLKKLWDLWLKTSTNLLSIWKKVGVVQADVLRGVNLTEETLNIQDWTHKKTPKRRIFSVMNVKDMVISETSVP